MKSLSALLIITLAITISAQEKVYGIKAGFTISNYWGSGTDGLNNQFRAAVPSLNERNLYWFTMGIFTTRELLPDFAYIQTELNYIRGGKNWKSTGDNSFQIFADYLQFPAVLKVTIPVILRPRIYVGPYMSYMFRARAQNVPAALDDAAFFSNKSVGSEIFEQTTNVIDLGMVTGLDFDIAYGPGKFVFDFRYNLGAINVFNNSSGAGVRNYMFLFMAGYALSLGGGS